MKVEDDAMSDEESNHGAPAKVVAFVRGNLAFIFAVLVMIALLVFVCSGGLGYLRHSGTF
jgi:hypothetical protein